VYWRADDPSDGSARADSNIDSTQARTTAVLTVPSDAKVTYARLYWGAYAANQSPNGHVRVERPGSTMDASLTAARVWTVQEKPMDAAGRYWYQAAADLTDLVSRNGSGPYRVSEVSSLPLSTLNGDYYGYVAWYMVVFYQRASEPQRNLALFEGLDYVSPDAPASVTLSGFVVPPDDVGYDAKLGVVAFEGDAVYTGDALSLDGNVLSDDQNPADNFFNSTRSYLGKPVSVPGDLPQLTGTARSMSGIDIDVLDVSPLVKPSQTTAKLEASSTLDTYLLGAFVTSFATFKPNFQSSQKTIVDVNGGEVLTGDVLEYTIAALNRGSDVAVQAHLKDTLPAGVTYVPGSLAITGGGSSSGAKTDASGDDEAEYDATTRTVTARLGSGAGATTGGSIAIDETVTLRFRVTIDATTRGQIKNQAVITAAGQRGADAEDTPTDGDIMQTGAQSTDTKVGGCTSDMDCAGAKPHCDLTGKPPLCVECTSSADCAATAAPDCLTTTHVCGCSTGSGKCQQDTDNDGISDDGELIIGSDPRDADSDDDGLLDGAELSPELDSDGDGLSNVLDADSDNDGLFDGTERGQQCDNPDTDRGRGRCRPDGDRGNTQTNPLRADTDDGGVSDGSEDFNLNGAIDQGETDPTVGHGADDTKHDTDGDGLSDELERGLRSDPNDSDTDDDGVPDGLEANPSEDTDFDKKNNVSDVDSDDDGLFDGTELGRDCASSGTQADRGHCRADGDLGSTKTSPLLRDTDGGGARDGAEDANGNGVVDNGERNPTAGHGEDDAVASDTDGDGLSDDLELRVGSAPDDADSDDDGLRDGDEPNPLDDQDGDRLINLLDPDSDGDGLPDGLERGKTCDEPATDKDKKLCIADADRGATTTGVLNDDTDFGGVSDGVEDVNHNGRVDPGEINPNDPTDDIVGSNCQSDVACGARNSGRICVEGMCQLGCRGVRGNGCPSNLVCSSLTEAPGVCSITTITPPPTSTGREDAGSRSTGDMGDDGVGVAPVDGDSRARDAGTRDAGARSGDTETSRNSVSTSPDAGWGPPGSLEGGGCNCHVTRSRQAPLRAAGSWLSLLGLALFCRARVRSRRGRRPD
jgi:uncharacterized repeat protein (TIGR01451 family)